jgi:hypothetical protein
MELSKREQLGTHGTKGKKLMKLELRGRMLSRTYGTRSKRPNFYIPNSQGRELHEQWIIPTILRSNF